MVSQKLWLNQPVSIPGIELSFCHLNWKFPLPSWSEEYAWPHEHLKSPSLSLCAKVMYRAYAPGRNLSMAQACLQSESVCYCRSRSVRSFRPALRSHQAVLPFSRGSRISLLALGSPISVSGAIWIDCMIHTVDGQLGSSNRVSGSDLKVEMRHGVTRKILIFIHVKFKVSNI